MTADTEDLALEDLTKQWDTLSPAQRDALIVAALKNWRSLNRVAPFACAELCEILRDVELAGKKRPIFVSRAVSRLNKLLGRAAHEQAKKDMGL